MKSPKNMGIIQIDITNACAKSCSNCTRFCGHHKKPFFMNFDTFKRAVDSLLDFEGTIGIIGGEPTLHPEFERFVRYLESRLPKKKRKQSNRFIYPQNNYMAAIHDQEGEQIVAKNCGIGVTVYGAGLWSAVVPTYKKHYEAIHDVFKYMAVNDHSRAMYHQPALITRKELKIGDEAWLKLRENCWINQFWSASITPKGAFFCEIAAALDMLFDGPGGWPIEAGWWKREGDALNDQLHWCELCGLALNTFTRNANEELDDISPVIYEKLKAIGDPKLRTNHVNLLKIKDGIISHESKAPGELGAGGLHYTDSYFARFDSEKSVLFPKLFEGVILCEPGNSIEEIIASARENICQLDCLYILCGDAAAAVTLSERLRDDRRITVKDCHASRLGVEFNNIFKESDWENYIVVTSSKVLLADSFHDNLKNYILNPGTLHYIDFSQPCSRDTKYIKNADQLTSGFAAILNKEASSLRKIGFDGVANSETFQDIRNHWQRNKIVELSKNMDCNCPDNQIQNDLKYALYGVEDYSNGVVKQLAETMAELICVVDSDANKWGCDFHGKVIQKPEYLAAHRGEFDKVLIGSWIHYCEIKDKLFKLGFTVKEMTSV